MIPPLELLKQKQIMTCGITNKPLEKPAYIWFIIRLDNVGALRLLDSLTKIYSLDFETKDFPTTNKRCFQSKIEIEPKILRQIWMNYKRTLRPKFKSNFDYLFFEIDSKDSQILKDITEVYACFSLPLYYHESLRGYHFISVKPISHDVWIQAYSQIKKYNPEWPPVTLRINPNKYPNEKQYFDKDRILTPNGKSHHDSEWLRNRIRESTKESYAKIGEKYVITWYSLANKQGQQDVWGLEENDL